MMDHIEQLQDGIAKIKEGLSQFNAGPASFTMDCLFAAYHTLIDEYAHFKVGERVELKATPASAIKRESGWWHCQHFLIPGNGATVRHVKCDSKGRLRYDVVFDRETWIDIRGLEKPVSGKHAFCFFEHELVSYREVLR